MALHLPCTITLLHSYNGHIPRIFPDVHVISLIQVECATTPDSPLRPSRRGPRGLSLTPPRFSHRPVYARLRLPTRRRARATWLVAYSAVTLPSTGPRESSGYDPKTSEDGCPLRSLRALASYAVWSSRTFGVRSEGGVPNTGVELHVRHFLGLLRANCQ